MGGELLDDVVEVRGEVRQDGLQRLVEVLRLCCHGRLESHRQQDLSHSDQILLL